ncbi:kinase of RNA polymerase II carboxy-terminal domain (CTD), alpha subunit [Scheffersomyces stipitis CBS 6054]|uniref:Serine/threonine-protein kinase BUR1 n=1 Tax=Scheffersomyces stipitis (strain ATCC 58785 / CBS 6054 / NBRC 10063 / NRRL Y-11545) TaxID=322104 RepID=A3LUH2_PICST|nr:kinase of RNA polymerase II carboxy-terminal domain (CTD), alpha subunit [Scheffersomyces stipitis CBS 6054]ABN66237.2 kinase of RNA polymerase II carboxy-terminal domain (CTD), alpha subunit [Scheffersomyces stipitis CBS 6054]
MSDRYRPPPAGPRSSRDFQRKPSFKSRERNRDRDRDRDRDNRERDVYKPGGSQRDRERDMYRPRNDTYTPKKGPDNHKDVHKDTPNDTHKDEPSLGSKRGPPSGPSSYRKRRELAKEKEKKIEPFRGIPSGRGPPLGPRGGKKAGATNQQQQQQPKPPKQKPQKLSKSQIYSIYVPGGSRVYQRTQQVGEGTYGKVYKAKNTKTNEFVALKKLRLESEREGFPITAMREIKLLQSFDHPNIVGLLEMMVEQNQIYMIFDYMDHDLTGFLSHPDLVLEEGHCKYIFQQLMEGLNYLHKKRVIHRDIKGSNILLDSTGCLKIADFGLARTMKIVNDGESPDYTNRVITIWYRPPELLLGATDYGREVDIWGVGCLLIELYTKVAAFQGFDEVGQLCRIFNVMGTPSIVDWPDIQNLPWFEMLKPKVNVASKFKAKYESAMSPDGFDLALNLLRLNPKARFTAEQALQHRYFTEEPFPLPLTFLKDVEGEWHEFETKKRRRKERKRLQDEAKAKQNKDKQSQGTVDVDASLPVKSVSEVPLDIPQSSTVNTVDVGTVESNIDSDIEIDAVATDDKISEEAKHPKGQESDGYEP